MANEALAKLAKLGTIDELAAATSAKIGKVEAAIPSKTSQLTNDSKFQTDTQVSAAISSQIGRVYKPAGTIEFAALPELSAEVLGNVYNISDKFTTDTRFVDGIGGKHPAGTNVAVVQVGEEFKFDVLAGAVDFSNYVEKVDGKSLSSNDYTDEDKAKLDGFEIATDTECKAVIDKYFPQTT